MKKKALMSEVRQLQKIAGILKEEVSASTINWDYPEIDFESEDTYYEYNPEEDDYVISVTVYGTGEDSKKYKGMYTTNVASLEGEELDNLDLDPEKIDDIELV
jgi:hypothetical protein